MLPFCCHSLSKFICNPHKYWYLVIVWCHRAISFILFRGKVFILQSTGSIELFFLKYQKLHPDFLLYFVLLPFLDVS